MPFETLNNLLKAIQHLDNMSDHDYLSIITAYRNILYKTKSDNYIDAEASLFLILRQLVETSYKLSIDKVEL